MIGKIISKSLEESGDELSECELPAISDEETYDLSDDDLDAKSDDDEYEQVSDDEIEDEQEGEMDDQDEYMLGKDGETKWRKTSFYNEFSKSKPSNVFTKTEGVRGAAKQCQTILSCFELFFDHETFTKVVLYTNIYIDLIRPSDPNKHRKFMPSDLIEIRAFFGFLFFLGSKKIGKGNIGHFWSNDFGSGWKLCKPLIAYSRYLFLLRCIRFDDKSTRTERLKVDCFAIVQEIFTHINNKFKQHYEPGFELCIDEQLLKFRGRVKFKQYIPSKPAKYGLKVWALVDVNTMYTCALKPYVGRQPQTDPQGNENVFYQSTAPFDLVMRIANDFLKCGRNITADNWFTSFPLVQRLTELKTSYVGTVRKNKREIPNELQAFRSRDEFSSKFGFQKLMTLVSYVPKKLRFVLLVSSQHFDAKIDERTKNKMKPEIVTYYNGTKYAVDVVDQMCSSYNVARTTRRWPWIHIFNLMNVSGINARVIYKANTKKQITRKEFLNELAKALMIPHLKRRARNTNLSYATRKAAAEIADIKISGHSYDVPHQIPPLKSNRPNTRAAALKTARIARKVTNEQMAKQRRCFECKESTTTKKTRLFCKMDGCSNPTCDDHLVKMCPTCYKELLEA